LFRRTSIRAGSATFRQNDEGPESEVDKVKAYETGGWIAESGTVTSEMTPRSGGPAARHSSHYFMLWRHDGERWRIDRYIDTANL
jgi:hypothetical protein